MKRITYHTVSQSMKASRQDSAVCIYKVLAFVACKVLNFNGQSPKKCKNMNAHNEVKQSVSNVTFHLPIFNCTHLNNNRSKYTPFYGKEQFLPNFLVADPFSLRKMMKDPPHPCSSKYRVIHKSLRNFQTRLRNNQDRHDRKEHINR